MGAFSCAAPEAIPEEIFTAGAEELGEALGQKAENAFTLAKAIREAGRFSLIKRDAERKTLTIHRLVQVILQDGMDEETQRLWAERAVRAVNAAFPGGEVNTWPQCERLLPHAQIGAELIEKWRLELPQAARLLNQAGYYLYERARYKEAAPLFQRALTIWETSLGPEHPNFITCLRNYASLLRDMKRDAEDERIETRARKLEERRQQKERERS
ncbi:MAG: tetratricopeptide repeat protein [Candidatus Binatia bacterium]